MNQNSFNINSKKPNNPSGSESGDGVEKAISPMPRNIPGVQVREVMAEVPDQEKELAPTRRLEDRNSNNLSDDKRAGRKVKKLKRRGALKGEDVRQEERWGVKAKTGVWLAISIVALVVVVMGAVVVKNSTREIPVDNQAYKDLPAVSENPYKDSPEEWFRKSTGKMEPKALELIDAFVVSDNIQEKSLLVRNPDEYLKRQLGWKGGSISSRARQSKNYWGIKHTEEEGFLTLDTQNEDFLPMRVYFVKTEDGLKIDWSASTAWSERSFVDLKQTKDNLDGDLLLRCLLRRRNDFYAGPYNDTEHASFMILSPDKSRSFWGYVDRDSELDKQLKSLLDHGSFVVSLKKDIRVTLRVGRGKKDALPSQLELLELVHEEWVKP